MARRGDNIYKRKDNRWEGRYPCGYRNDGKTKYHSVYGKTYAEVKRKLSEINSSNLKNIVHSNMTVKELFEEWLIKISSKVKKSTLENYRMKIKKHILPEFGGLKYDFISSSMVYQFINNKLESGFSAKYISDIVVIFKSMAKYVSLEYCYHNPLINVSLPKKEKNNVRILAKDEENRLLNHLNRNFNRTSLGIVISLYTGLRIGELCALKWSDIDLKKRVLNVKHTLQRVSTPNGTTATTLSMTSPKTSSSVRQIPLPKFLTDIMEKFKGYENTFILSNTIKPVEPRTMQYRFSSILKKANLPSVHFHSLRHLFATNCIELGFDVKSLSEILGHSSVEVTLNRYVHSSFEQKRICMDKIPVNF